MRIGIDCRMYNESGVGRYTRNLLVHLQELDKGNEYFIFLLRNEYDRLEYHNKKFHKVLADFRWYGVTEQIKLPQLLAKHTLDLVHFPHFNVPIFYKGKFVVTIHDLIHQHFSMDRSTTHGSILYKFKKLGYNYVFQHAITKSLKIFVPSYFVKEQLIREWGVDKGKIITTPEAVDNKIYSIVGKMNMRKIEAVMKKFKVKSPYIFYVGNAHPHKNLEGLIKVFRKVKEKYPDLTLVLAGFDHYFWQRLKKEHHFPGLTYTGSINDEEMVALFSNAEMFVLPSFEEGFGLPILEAMACSCAAVSSEGGALREVGRDAALYFDPKDLGDMKKKIDRALCDESLRNKLIRQGQKRVKLFSWKRLARQTLEVYHQCA